MESYGNKNKVSGWSWVRKLKLYMNVFGNREIQV